MDEREVRDLLKNAAASIAPSTDLSDRAEQRYRRRRARGRVVAAVVVLAIVGSGVATAEMVGNDHDAPKVVAPTSTLPRRVEHVDPKEFASLAFRDATTGYGVAPTELEPVLAKTEDGGRTWRAVGRMPRNADSISVMTERTDSGPSLLAWGSGLYVSTDDGSHWKRTRSESIDQVAVVSDRVWATTFCVGLGHCSDAVAFSDDGGRTWHDAKLRPTPGAATLVAAARDVVYVVMPGRGGWVIAKTSDGGSHWTSEPTPCPGFTESTSLARNDRVLLLACVGQPAGLTTMKRTFLSSDDGRTWKSGGQLGGSGASVVALGSTFVANESRAGIFASTDDGRTWRVVLVADAVQVMTVLAGVGAWVAVLSGENNGFWFSADGVHWEERGRAGATSVPAGGRVALRDMTALSFVDANVGFGLTAHDRNSGSDAVRTDDGGRTWRRVGALVEFENFVHFENASQGVAWGNGPLQVTTDGGVHWSATDGPVDNALSWAEGRLWAMTPCVQSTPCGSRPVLISDDVGQTWRPTASLRLGFGGAALLATSRSTAYYAEPATDQLSGSSQLAVTNDDGASWRYEPVPCPTSTGVSSLAFNGDALLLVCMGQPAGTMTMIGVWTSTNGGRDWTASARPDGFGGAVTNVGSTFVANTVRGPILSSTDEGGSWKESLPSDASPTMSAPLPGVGIWALPERSGSGYELWFSADGVHWERRNPDH